MNPQPAVSGPLPGETLRAQRLPCTPPGTAVGTGWLETPQENWEHPGLCASRWHPTLIGSLLRASPVGGWWPPPGIQRTPRLG